MKLGRREKILLVDDDQMIVRLIRTILESHGYECVTASSGAQGVGQFDPQEIDLIITDLNMAVGDGITLVRAIRRVSAVPIVIVSGFAREWGDQLATLDNVRVLPKPIETASLLKEIRHCCSQPRVVGPLVEQSLERELETRSQSPWASPRF